MTLRKSIPPLDRIRALPKGEREMLAPFMNEFQGEQRVVFATLYLAGRRRERVLFVRLRRKVEANRRHAEEAAELARNPSPSSFFIPSY